MEKISPTPFSYKDCKKIPINDVKITVPKLYAGISNPSSYWSHASQKSNLKIVNAKANIDAIDDMNLNNEIPYSVPSALLLAYKYHADVLLRPDDVWLMICHGLSKHININSEKLRKLFVDHEGKKDIVIVRPEPFEKMNWESATEDFAAQLQKEVKGDFVKTVIADFSTTTKIDYTASLLSVMASMKHFFTYKMICGSGIRNVYMAGTLEDWKKLKEKTESLAKYELDWWIKKLLPIIDNFILTYLGKPDLKFWNYMVDMVDGIGGSGMRTKKSDFTGWIIHFYPYQKNGYPTGEKIKSREFPNIVLKSPVIVKDLPSGKQYNMKFLTGFSGIGYSDEIFTPQLSYAYAIKEPQQ